MRNKNTVAIAVALACASCATPVPINSNLDNLVLTSVSPSKTPVDYTFESEIDEQHTIAVGAFDSQSNIKPTFGAMAETYIQTKFAKRSPSGVKVRIRLVEYQAAHETHDAILALSSSGSSATARATLKAAVVVGKSGAAKVERPVLASASINFNTADPGLDYGRLYSDLMNQASNRAIIMIDKMIASEGL